MRHYLLNLLLLIFIGITSFSCTKEHKLKKAFQNKVFVIDSVIVQSENNALRKSGTLKQNQHVAMCALDKYILKTNTDSLFDIYRDQSIEYDKYKIDGDILWIHKSHATKYDGYHLIKINQYTYELRAINKLTDESSIFITDVTDLFNQKVDNSKSEIIQKLNNTAWYPVMRTQGIYPSLLDTIYKMDMPEYYLDSNAVVVQNYKIKYDGRLYPSHTMKKYTNNAVYVFDTIQHKFIGSFAFKFDEANKMTIFSLVTALTFKRIDPTLLVNLKSIPKKERLGCSVEKAEWKLISYLPKLADGLYVYNAKSIELIDADEIQCKYSFRVKRYMKSYPEYSDYYKFIVSFEDDNKVYVQRYPIY